MVLIALITPLIWAASVSAAVCATKNFNCKTDGLSIAGLPSTLPPPTFPLSIVSVAIGTQNYTCSAAGNYTSTGAVAILYDISCLSANVSSKIQDEFMAAWQQAPASTTARSLVPSIAPTKASHLLGYHYFITNPNGPGLSPKWDFTSTGKTKGNPLAYVVAAKVGDVPAPTGPQDVDWLALNSVSGSLGHQVYRTDTRGGQPPPKCTLGSPDIQVKYAAKYWFYGTMV